MKSLQMYLNSGSVVLPVVCVLFIFGCRSEKEPADETSGSSGKIYDHWLIDFDMVESGCERVDCIRSLDQPKFVDVNDVDFLNDDNLVIGLKIGDEIKCYPHVILDYHEIVNDELNKTFVAVNYCPLTGSGMAWNRKINGKITTFGISGLLYNSNVIPYDRNTRSAWSQMKEICVNGELESKKPDMFPVIETKWSTWKKMFPDSKVVSLQTGMQRDYGTYPYYDYKETADIMFEVEHESDSLPQKERLYGIVINGKAKCYRFNNFKSGIRILNDDLNSKNIIVVGSQPDNFIVAFENPGNKKFSPSKNKLPGIFEDENENIYDAFGYCIDGPEKGNRLISLNGFIAYWFAWYAFYPDLNFI